MIGNVLTGSITFVILDGLEPPTSCMYCTFAHALFRLSYRMSCAASGVIHFFNRGHTSRLKFVFSLQLFFTGLSKGTCPFSIGGFIPPRTLPTITCTRFSADAVPASILANADVKDLIADSSDYIALRLMGMFMAPSEQFLFVRFIHLIRPRSEKTRRLPTFSWGISFAF